ncbi:uncharacterized protein LOC131667837 [Phymastichus coffea]|uniref:uncharacterized protein LOC131667837 n=1 Tax=Phymastichus coffea TaxID=108790 RepID=UPI00273C35EB|nr:uncharacterized protein LOC131667837 [Phymastichus coffea]
MYSSQRYFQYFAVFFLFSLCSIRQVSSRKCYACISDINTDCITGNLSTTSTYECNKDKQSNSLFYGNINSLDQTNKTTIEYDCAYLRGVALSDGHVVVIRGCVPKYITCDTTKMLAIQGNAQQIDTCTRCDADLCNSSGHLKAGLPILLLLVLMRYLIKF